MTSTTAKPNKTQPNIYHCNRCGVAYDWRRSTSTSLRMTYCGTLCEVSDLGCSIDELLRSEITAPVILDVPDAEGESTVALAPAA